MPNSTKSSKSSIMIALLVISSLIIVSLVSSVVLIPKDYSQGRKTPDDMKWSEINTTNFVINYTEGESVIAEDVSKIAEDIYPDAISFMRFSPQNKTNIIVSSSPKIGPGFGSFGISGSAIGGYITLGFPSEWSAESYGYYPDSPRYAFAHEFNHIILSRMIINYSIISFPNWLLEGTANYFGARYLGTLDTSSKALTKYLIEEESLSSLDELYYGGKFAATQGYTIVKFIFENYGDQKFHELIDYFRNLPSCALIDVHDAILAVFGKPISQFEADWITYLEEEYLKDFESQKIDGIALTNTSAQKVPSSWYGDNILYTSDETGDLDIFVMNTNGSNSVQLTNSHYADTDPKYSPDGKKIAFTSKRSGNYDIFSMDSDGSILTQLTYNVHIDVAGSWSSDGSKITFTSSRSGNYEIWVMDADGNNAKQLTDNPAKDGSPAFSPVAGRIAFASNRNGNYDLYLMDEDGTDIEQITHSLENESFPSWSPDGSKIIFVSKGHSIIEIRELDVRSGSLRKLTSGTYYILPSGMLSLIGFPVYSPSGDNAIIACGNEIYLISIIEPESPWSSILMLIMLSTIIIAAIASVVYWKRKKLPRKSK